MPNGIKTTEFWVTVFVILGSVATQLTSANVFPPQYAGLVAAVAAAAYAISRGIKKNGTGGN